LNLRLSSTEPIKVSPLFRTSRELNSVDIPGGVSSQSLRGDQNSSRLRLVPFFRQT
jgi:hypothetical protein